MATLKFGTTPTPAAGAKPAFSPPRVDPALAPKTESKALTGELEPAQPEPLFNQVYTCHPIHKMSFGKFFFQGGKMELKSQNEVDEFDALLATQPPQLKMMVTKLDRNLADSFVAKRIGSRAVSGMDTTANSFGPEGIQRA